MALLNQNFADSLGPSPTGGGGVGVGFVCAFRKTSSRKEAIYLAVRLFTHLCVGEGGGGATWGLWLTQFNLHNIFLNSPGRGRLCDPSRYPPPIGGVFALRAHCALLLDYVPPEEPPSKPLGNTLRIR